MAQIQEDRPFNMAMLYFEGIQWLIMKYTEAMIIGDVRGGYECTQELFIKVRMKITKEEDKEIKDKLEEIKKFLIVRGSNSPNKDMIQDRNYSMAKEHIRECVTIILKRMLKAGMLFPNIEVKSGLDGIREKYGLDKEEGESG